MKVQKLKNDDLVGKGGKKDNVGRDDRVRLSMTGKRLRLYLRVFEYAMEVTQAQIEQRDIPKSGFEPALLDEEIRSLLEKVDELKTPLLEEVDWMADEERQLFDD